MNYNNLCYRCFYEKQTRDESCPKCGYSNSSAHIASNCLLPGALLKKRYIVGMTLGVGGFGITYKCFDTKIGGICAVKEYFPSRYAMRDNKTKYVSVADNNLERYQKIMRRFVEEANLVKSLNHRNIIQIYDSFSENNTAYYVMEYCNGIDLRRYTNNFTRKLEYDEGLNILYQIMNGLEYVHSKGILHRDIAPDNIYVTKNNTVKILDFGAARKEMDQYNKELSVIVKVGYAPIEQYGGRGMQGPYTDIYALGATFYHLFTSRIPVESTQRVAEDNLVPFSRLRPDLPDKFKYCIEKAMELTTAKRIANIAEMKRILGLGSDSVIISKEPPISQGGTSQSNYSHSTSSRSRSGGFSQNRPEVATVGKRVGAYLIDMIVWSIVYFLLFANVFGNNANILFPLAFTAINIVSELIFSSTLGKALLKLQVRGKSGNDAEPSQIVIRNIIKLLGIFVVVFGKNNQLLEDIATDSIVCEKKR